ncbi:hypothetical protein GGR58DRAFT_467575 [Xylaria digitata]|nr:hypothetical protein GGR58DRAFT_467575 [Xylaria digitata]
MVLMKSVYDSILLLPAIGHVLLPVLGYRTNRLESSLSWSVRICDSPDRGRQENGESGKVSACVSRGSALALLLYGGMEQPYANMQLRRELEQGSYENLETFDKMVADQAVEIRLTYTN